MKLVPYDLEDVKFYKKTKNYDVLTEFANSDLNCVRVDGFTHTKPNYCANSLRESIKRFGMDNILVSTRKGTVLLIEKSWLEERQERERVLTRALSFCSRGKHSPL